MLLKAYKQSSRSLAKLFSLRQQQQQQQRKSNLFSNPCETHEQKRALPSRHRYAQPIRLSVTLLLVVTTFGTYLLYKEIFIMSSSWYQIKAQKAQRKTINSSFSFVFLTVCVFVLCGKPHLNVSCWTFQSQFPAARSQFTWKITKTLRAVSSSQRAWEKFDK